MKVAGPPSKDEIRAGHDYWYIWGSNPQSPQNDYSFIFTRDDYIPLYEKRQKEMNKMILFTILAIVLAILLVVAVVAIGVGGGLFMTLFCDVIVCIVLVVLCIKFVARFRNR